MQKVILEVDDNHLNDLLLILKNIKIVKNITTIEEVDEKEQEYYEKLLKSLNDKEREIVYKEIVEI
jgi:D-ribose pyranose/furanose isomerase RbsD